MKQNKKCLASEARAIQIVLRVSRKHMLVAAKQQTRIIVTSNQAFKIHSPASRATLCQPACAPRGQTQRSPRSRRCSPRHPRSLLLTPDLPHPQKDQKSLRTTDRARARTINRDIYYTSTTEPQCDTSYTSSSCGPSPPPPQKKRWSRCEV